MKIFLTKNKFAYDRIKRGIITGEFKPCERLIISKLSKSLGISIIPVREAINRLATEGLVVNTPHVGPIVSPVNFDDLKENYIIRSELEGLATLYAAEHLKESDFRRLQENIDQMRDAINNKEFAKFGPINKEFHQIIYKSCPYKKLYKLICDLWNDIDRLQSIFALVPNRATSSFQEHIEILDALRKRDGLYSSSLVKKQKQLAWKDLESYYNSNKTSDLNSKKTIL